MIHECPVSTTHCISIVGLGKVGMNLLAAIASKGIRVIGVDIEPRLVELLNAGLFPISEDEFQLNDKLNPANISATLSYAEAISQSDVTLIIVPTPTDKRGAFSLVSAASAFKEIGKCLRKKKTYHNVVLLSTVLPGSTRRRLIPVIERYADKSVGGGFGVCYNPQFVALGTVIRDFLQPDFVLMGESDVHAGVHLEQCYRRIISNRSVYFHTSLENAEIAKLSINSFITSKITFVNVLGELCQRIPGADVDEVSRIVGADRRIGSEALKAGLGYGGPCFPRDNRALAFLCRSLGIQGEFAESIDLINGSLPEWLVSCFKRELVNARAVAVLGLSYKPGTAILEESQSIKIVECLLKCGLRVYVHDPKANPQARDILGGRAIIEDSSESCVGSADVVILASPDPVFKMLESRCFMGKIVIDLWRIRTDLMDQPTVHYIPMGRCGTEEDAMLFQSLWRDWPEF